MEALSGFPTCVITFLHKMPPVVGAVASTIGFGVAGLVAFKFLCLVWGFLYRNFLRPGKNLKKYGDWAVVTGSTDGIGKAYAFELARKGLNIVLVSRTQSKLDEVAKQIADKHKVEVKTVAADFAGDLDKAVESIRSATESLKVGILVNNVGLSYEYPEYFSDLDAQRVKDLIQINVSATTHVTQIFIGKMKKRGSGAIINLTSVAGEFPTPLLAIYSASKSYVSYFSKTLHEEYKANGVHVQLVVPLYVVSNMSKIRKPSFFTPTPEAFARAAVSRIGYDAYSVPYWPHALQIGVVKLLPEFVCNRIFMSTNESIRRRALKKQKGN
eukprot:TRINITY_DN20002_c0_g1_i1.p1 TRINITY_DN20002_c0_g1~~TRINITY_DN20002_c0_g1_i1.p1  ORF type:complete len:327 (+),score=87.99 TRINITY_DN20002_c0_g1_i1:50-1030(+)